MKSFAEKVNPETLERIAGSSPHWTELRYHRRRSHSFSVQNGNLKQSKIATWEGVGIRVLVDGAWGFSATSDVTPAALEKAIARAIDSARAISTRKRSLTKKLPSASLARGEFVLAGYHELERMPLDQKLQTILAAERELHRKSTSIQSAASAYTELFEDKIVVTQDGARAVSQLARTELRFTATAAGGGEMAEGHASVGRTGSWECLFQPERIESLTDRTAGLAVDLLKAPRIPGGPSTIILSPAMVGLLAHEAIGHTVEADFVLSGSVAAGKIGQRVASPLVSLADGGTVDHAAFGGGDLLVDDEGVKTQTTTVIRDGILESYLHNRETAAHFGVEPTGSARAWLYSDEPLIRMRNTYVQPGTSTLDEMIATTKEGYLIDGPLGGQADATGEFMFGAQKVYEIRNGKLGKLLRGATISGKAFDVLSTVDAVSKEFKLDLGSGYCGKGQPAKVDAGGPYLRCKALLGGVQE